jgi:D-proline reductase (dithiol) PrdB
MCHRSVGLAQNALEQAGIATVSVTMAPTVTYGVGVPRALYVRFPYGNPYGEPGDDETQRQILHAAIQWLYDARKPNQMARLACGWRRRPRDGETSKIRTETGTR